MQKVPQTECEELFALVKAIAQNPEAMNRLSTEEISVLCHSESANPGGSTSSSSSGASSSKARVEKTFDQDLALDKDSDEKSEGPLSNAELIRELNKLSSGLEGSNKPPN